MTEKKPFWDHFMRFFVSMILVVGGVSVYFLMPLLSNDEGSIRWIGVVLFVMGVIMTIWDRKRVSFEKRSKEAMS